MFSDNALSQLRNRTTGALQNAMVCVTVWAGHLVNFANHE